MRLIGFFCVLFSLFAAGSVSGQQSHGLIRGNVRNQDDLPLAGATAMLAGGGDTLSKVVDSRGAFSFAHLRNGRYEIEVSYIGLRTFRDSSLLLRSDRPVIDLPVVVLVATDRRALKAAVVARQRPLIEQKIDRTIVNVDAMITAAGSNALEVLGKGPGVMIDANDNISLNGKSNVLVLIDNRPTYMSGADLAAYLRSLPAGMLDKLELIPNPPAQYDAAGGAVINIVLKKIRDAGVNGGLNGSYNQGYYGRSNDALTFNYHARHTNLFGNVGYGLDQNYSNETFSRYFYAGNGILGSSARQTSGYHYRSEGWNGRLGMDYMLSPRTTVGWMVNGSTRPKKDWLSYNNSAYDGAGSLDSTGQGATQGVYTWRNIAVNANAAHTFRQSGAKVSADLDWVRFYSFGRQDAPLATYLPNGQIADSQNRIFELPGQIDIYSGKVDDVAPLSDGAELNAGLKWSSVTTDDALNWFTALNGKPVEDYSQSNRFRYREQIASGYVNLHEQWRRWGVQTGLRAENTAAAGHQLPNPDVADSAFRLNYTSLFPSEYLSYKLDSSGHHLLVLSFTRKIRRPNYQQLNPFLIYQNQYSYAAGNPELQPYYYQSIELKYAYMQYVGLTVGYLYGNHEIQGLTQAEGDIFMTRPANFIRYRAVSFVPTFNLQPTTWWSLHANAVLLYIRNNGSAPGVNVDQTTNVHEFETSNEFRLPGGWSAELDGFFPGKQTFAQSQSDKALFNISGGVRKSILGGWGTLNVTFNDLLGTFSRSLSQTIDIADVTAYSTRVTDTRRVGVAFSYRLGRSANASQVRHDRGGAEEEEDRTK